MNTLKLGSKGADVKVLQKRLNLIPDGIFGNITLEAVKEFQRQNGLFPDGVVGTSTWEALGFTSRKINEIIVHCSATPEGKDYSVADIRKWHIQRGFGDIGYHYVIYRDGTVHKGRSIGKIGAHASGHNSYSIGICYIGGCASDGKTAKDTRTPQQKTALIKLVKELMDRYSIDKYHVFGHYQFANKACPSFKIEDLRKDL